ncbi:putative RNA-directed DNA polymerase from mobile element jockey-like 87, partial [Homarus americanus]
RPRKENNISDIDNLSLAIHPVAEPPTFAIPTVMKYKIPKETGFNHAYKVVVALELEYKNIKFGVKPNLVGDLILPPPPRPQHSQDPQRGHQSQQEDGQDNTIRPRGKTTRMVLLRYPLELPVEVTIKHPKVTKAERCVTSQDKAQTKQVLVDIKGTVPEEVDLGNWGTYKLRPFVPEPLRCYKCQKFGHHQSRCHKKVRCGIWSQSHKTEMCIQKHKEGTTTTTKCPNCGKKHHTSSTPCPERRERMKVAMAKIQPQNTTEAPQSTFVWGQQRQKTVTPTPTPPQLSEDSFPALPPPGYRTKLKTPGQNQSTQETMTNQWTPQPQLKSCIAVKAQNTPVLVENTILQEEELAIREITQNRETSSPLQQITRNRTTNTDRQQTYDHRQERQHPEERRKNSRDTSQNKRNSTSCSSLRAGAQEIATNEHTIPNGRGGERLIHERREQLQHRRRGDNDRIAPPPCNLKITQWNRNNSACLDTIPSSEVEPVHCGEGVEAQAVRIHLANDSLVVYNIYKPPPKRLEAGELLTQATQELVLIAGDFNAHHPTINPTTTKNQDGHHLVELLTDVPEITLINTGEPTHILGGTLDLTFISTEPVISDHFATTTTLRVELLPPSPRPPPRWNTKKANWKLYQDELQKMRKQYQRQTLQIDTTKTTGSTMTKSENRIAESSFRRHLRQYPSPEGVKLLRAAVQHARQITQKIREDKWLEWCATFNAHTNLSELWRKLRIATGKLPRAPARTQPLQEANRLT